MKLYDGRGKRFKRLIDPKVIMDENRLKLTEVLPKHARDKWYAIWFRGFLFTILGMSVPLFLVGVLFILLDGEPPRFDELLAVLLVVLIFGILAGGFTTLTSWRWVWKSKSIAIRTLAQLGFCPNCGYIIRGTPAEDDGCTPCSECGHAWVVEESEC